MRIIALAALSLSLISGALIPCAYAADDPFNGDWKLSQTKARSAVKGPVTQLLHIESDETSLLVAHKGTDPAGEPLQWRLKTDYSGNPNGILNAPQIDSVRCWRTAPRIITIQLFREGVSTGYWAAEVSKNGKTLKVTTTTYDAAGKETAVVDMFDRQ